ncbi:hypothetical protein [Roseivivax sp.]
MTTEHRDPEDIGPEAEAALERYFTAGRAHPPALSPELLARLTAEAQGQARAHGRARRPARAGLAGLIAALGGWPALAGLATTAVAGFWIGLAPPDLLAPSVEALWSGDSELAFYLAPAQGLEALDTLDGEG